ncbi:MAG: hypothetical protein CFE44_19035 [Burkholderiales bacterium PBB4]|nr:MAG: hypothetical protein CFE44_19035 [Burkholderiales bacterium PBB4]
MAVVGNVAQRRLVEADMQRLAVGARVFFLGALESVLLAFQAANCLAHPTLEDTFAMVVLEAMACGLPVVVSGRRYCGIAHLLVSDRDALLLQNPLDVGELASKLSQALFDAQVRATLQAAALKFASEHLWSVKAQELQIIYDEVVASAREVNP